MRADEMSERHFSTRAIPSSLFEATIGDEVVVGNILFPSIRAACRHSGIAVGDRLRIEGHRRRQILVRNRGDQPVWLSNLVAYFINVWKLKEKSDPVVVIGHPESGSTRWIGIGPARRI